jgi:antitoxin component of MazEF toxin-antitoxin module
MRALQKLVRNGNATAVTIPRAILHTIGWLPGEAVVLELLEDSTLRIRRPCDQDFAPVSVPRILTNPLALVTK